MSAFGLDPAANYNMSFVDSRGHTLSVPAFPTSTTSLLATSPAWGDTFEAATAAVVILHSYSSSSTTPVAAQDVPAAAASTVLGGSASDSTVVYAYRTPDNKDGLYVFPPPLL